MKVLRRNWWLPVSAAAYFCLQAQASVPYFLGIFMAAGLIAWKSSRMERIWDRLKGQSAFSIFYALMSAGGICWAGLEQFRRNWQGFDNLGVFLSLIAFGAVYVFSLCFLHWLAKLLLECGAFRNFGRWEKLCYALLFLSAIMATAFIFFRTDASYGTVYEFDIVYTSDSPVLVKENAYLNLTHKENDLRQPLFAVFTGPLLGAAYFLGKLTGNTAVQAVLMNCVLLGMLFAAHLLLARTIELTAGRRACFLILAFCSYTNLLFSWMMEQYIPAYFFLMLCICQCCRKENPDRSVLWGAGGTLLTSLILLPCLSTHSPHRDRKMWLRDMLLAGAEFFGVMLIFCRLDVLATALTRALFLSSFTGTSVTLWERVCQYTVFLRSCFLAPVAGVSYDIPHHISWQLVQAESLDWGGILLLTLCCFSAWWNRKKKSSRIAAAWCIVSLAVLLVIGWGTKENGLILYSLYFGWAFFVLLFQLAERLEEKLEINWLVPVLTGVFGAAMLAVNIPAMGELIHFAMTWFRI